MNILYITIGFVIAVVALFFAYALWERHKYFNRYKLKRESYYERLDRKEDDHRNFNHKRGGK